MCIQREPIKTAPLLCFAYNAEIQIPIVQKQRIYLETNLTDDIPVHVMDTHPFGSAEPSRGGDRRVAAQGLATTGLGPGVQNIERCMSKI